MVPPLQSLSLKTKRLLHRFIGRSTHFSRIGSSVAILLFLVISLPAVLTSAFASGINAGIQIRSIK